MQKTALREAVEIFVQVASRLKDTDLEREEWEWRKYDGVRMAFLFTAQHLHEFAVATAMQRELQGSVITSVQRILAQHHRMYQDLRGALVQVKDEELDQEPAPGEWPLRTVFEHVMRAERGFFALIQYAVDRLRNGKDWPVEIPDDHYKAFIADISIETQGTLAEIYERFDTLHYRILGDLADISEEELKAPSIFWEGYEVEIRFRIHRFEAHLWEHTIQVDKTLAGIQHHPTEIERLLRVIYGALGDAEGALIGAWDANGDQQREVVALITSHAQQMASLPL